MSFSGKRMLGLTFAGVMAAGIGAVETREAYGKRVETLCAARSYQGPDAPDTVPSGAEGQVIRDVMIVAQNGCHFRPK